MNTRTPLIASALLAVCLSGTVHAALQGRDLNGSAGSFEAYYDTVLDITWLADANYAKTSGYSTDGLMAWGDANTWAANLTFTDGTRTYDNWRLPAVKPVDGVNFNDSGSFDGSSDFGYNITSPNSEMAFMYYVNLGNQATVTQSGAGTGCFVNSGDTCLDYVGPFSNLELYLYWSGTEVSHTPSPGGFFGSGQPGDSYGWDFAMIDGVQRMDYKSNGFYAWAVSSGDIAAVPEADTWAMLLAGLGLVGMAAIRRKESELQVGLPHKMANA